MGGYDLYGNYYPREIDALNAEMAQCAQIDSQCMSREAERQRDHEYDLMCRIHWLEERVERLEQAAGLATENQGRASEQPTTVASVNGGE